LAAVGIGLLTFAGLLATASSANASILASSRINFAMGRDKLISPKLNAVHPKFATPYRSIAVTGGLILLFIVVGDVKTLAKAGSVLHLIVYGLLNVGLIVMRQADTDDYQPEFKVPFYPAVPILGAVTSFGLIAFMEPIEIGLSGIFVVGGVLWYFGYARGKTEEEGILSEYILSRREEMPDTVVSAAAGIHPDGGEFRVMVPLANPEHEKDLITLASAIAKRKNGTLDAVHIVTVPDQTSLAYAADHAEDIEAGYHAVLDNAKRDAETFGVDIETHTIFSHKSFEEVFDAARTHGADLVVMGWGEDSHGSPGRVESALDDLVKDLPCDFLVLKDRGFNPDHILIPTAGGPDSDLSAEIAKLLSQEYDSTITLLHVSEDRARGEAFLEEWAQERGLSDADFRVETGAVEAALAGAADDATLVMAGASERGLLSRLLRGSPVIELVDDVNCSVLLAERARSRSLWDRFF
jgi:nucleotide-binding universal stress UspA family protein